MDTDFPACRSGFFKTSFCVFQFISLNYIIQSLNLYSCRHKKTKKARRRFLSSTPTFFFTTHSVFINLRITQSLFQWKFLKNWIAKNQRPVNSGLPHAVFTESCGRTLTKNLPIRPKSSVSGKTSSCNGRKTPAESTR